jgi:hypothetical protein
VAAGARTVLPAEAVVSGVLTAVNTAAMVLGYLVLALLLAFVCWIIGVWLDKWRYQRRRKRRHDEEWDRIRSKWLLEGDFERVRTNEYQVIDTADRIDTAVLGDPIGHIYDYEEELRRDAS